MALRPITLFVSVGRAAAVAQWRPAGQASADLGGAGGGVAKLPGEDQTLNTLGTALQPLASAPGLPSWPIYVGLAIIGAIVLPAVGIYAYESAQDRKHPERVARREAEARAQQAARDAEWERTRAYQIAHGWR